MESTPAPTTFRRFKVFSSRKVTMHVSDDGDVQPKKFWLVESDAKSNLTIRPIDEETWLPTGRPRPITVRELQKRFSPEEGLYEQRVHPNIEKFAGGPLETPQEEPERAVVDEAALHEEFDQALALLENGDPDKAKALFTKVLHSDAPFEEKHKHLFNDFAIQLRKNKQHNEAIAFYTRALELSWGNEDENLHINLARALYSEKQYGGCVQHLFDALRIAPGHRIARTFLAWLEQEKVVPKQYALQVRGCLAQRTAEEESGPEDPPPADGPETVSENARHS